MEAPSWEQSQFDALASLTRADMVTRVGTVFPVVGAVQLTLTAVDGEDDRWSATFEAPIDVLLEQGMHPVVHPTLGALPLFLVPGPVAPGVASYVATFA